MNLTMMFTIVFLFLIAVLLISVISSTRKESLKERELEIEWLEEQIEMKQNMLSKLTSQIESNTVNKKVNLPEITNEILDIYKDSNIKIPADIIEELSYMRLTNEKEIFDYIENQRYYWKLENTKKPYKKVK